MLFPACSLWVAKAQSQKRVWFIQHVGEATGLAPIGEWPLRCGFIIHLMSCSETLPPSIMQVPTENLVGPSPCALSLPDILSPA